MVNLLANAHHKTCSGACGGQSQCECEGEKHQLCGSANKVHIGEIQSSAGREVSQISRMDVEHKDGCLRVSPVWADVTLESTIQNIQAGM